MRIQDFIQTLNKSYYVGVPDSLLAPIYKYLIDTHGVNKEKHFIAVNEGAAVGLAAGYHLATGDIPVIYMQNSGIGNAVNPIASLLNELVYGIPMVFIIGWRGEPGVHDEPQHVFQGEITISLLEEVGVRCFVIDKETTTEDLAVIMLEFDALLKDGKQAAFVVKKGSFSYDGNVSFKNDYDIIREDAIGRIALIAEDDIIVSTTGKISRELYENRDQQGESHERDFLTVGSMGHASSIALGIALEKKDKKIWCIDGDGALLMHMGTLATIGSIKPNNIIHIVLNNAAHESVGGPPTVANDINICEVARACGYNNTHCVTSLDELDGVLKQAKSADELTFIEVKCAIDSRADLGRPRESAKHNKDIFMGYIS